MAKILGLSAFYHDSAAALVVDGRIVAAAQEERFTRKRHDERFPAQSIRHCLAQAGLRLADIDHVVFYDKPLLKFERLLETYLAYTPRGLQSFLLAMPVWLKEKLYFRKMLGTELAALAEDAGGRMPPLLFTEHHRAHAGAAFYPSPFDEAAVLCLDGVGEWATTSVWTGRGHRLTPLWEIHFPHSLGLLYSAFTYYCGFKVNSGEYKLMGLAPYGEPRYVQQILDHLVDLKPDGTFRLDMSYFDYATGLTMTNAKFDALFGGPPRRAESTLTQRDMDLARSIQEVTEEAVLRLGRTVAAETGMRNLCLGGGVALNCVANGRLWREGLFDRIWIQPAAGDAGSALGAALCAWHEYLDQPRVADPRDSMQGALLGPAFDDAEVRRRLDAQGAVYDLVGDDVLMRDTAAALAAGEVVGWFQGRMEFGPRALGNRSILGDPRRADMKDILNLKIKRRESFRPFAPSILREAVPAWFETDDDVPFMMQVFRIRVDKRKEIPAVTHVDGTGRLQTVTWAGNPRYARLIEAFNDLTGVPIVLNTSFNENEPVVCKPEEAIDCFLRTRMDVLVLGDTLIAR